MDIDKLEAGRELDALVAEKVMGLNLTVIPETCPYCDGYVSQNRDPGWCGSCGAYVNEPEPYSTDIAAAWEVVEKMRTWKGKGTLGCRACIEIHSIDGSFEEGENKPYLAMIWGKEGIAKTAPLAICRAALKAVMENA